MSLKRVNVLVYAGGGSTTSSVRHAVWSLRRLLGPNYAVLTVSGDQILKEPWMASCALLVMPGGADLGYARTLNGEGNRRIKLYVQNGGKYLGLCAGGYYGCARCEWEVGKKGMEVVGSRELAFFPGICRGLAFGGFEYQSEAGTRAAALQVVKEALATGGGAVPEGLRVYYNGGGVFVDAESFKERGVEVVARYTDKLAVEGGDAAMVYCKVGEGGALLSGPHPEFSGINLNRDEPSGPANYREVVDALVQDEKQRVDFMKACLIKLGLEVSQQTEAVPSLSLLHLSAAEPGAVSELVQDWQDAGIVTKAEDGREIIKGENETFVLHADSGDSWDMSAVHKTLAEASEAAGDDENPPTDASDDRLVDYNSLPRRLLLHETSTMPTSKQTPYFNHAAFFWNLKDYHSQHRDSPGSYGKVLLYGEVVTSTNTMLDKNPTWLERLPTGLVATATTQVAGRGRGSNVWVSPPGSMPFSFVLRHSLTLSASAPVVFVQYLAALAVVKGIQGYDQSTSRLPIKLKWPNDIYALDPTTAPSNPNNDTTKKSPYVKIGGILVNSSYSGGDYTLVVGIGLNVTNAAPTTSISHLLSSAAKNSPPSPQNNLITNERLLASILANFESLYTRFCRTGWDHTFEEMYYSHWLHSEQIVTLEAEGGVKARIKGITRDWGLLVAEELGWQDRGTGKVWTLQSDSNSFDFFRGLVRRKV